MPHSPVDYRLSRRSRVVRSPEPSPDGKPKRRVRGRRSGNLRGLAVARHVDAQAVPDARGQMSGVRGARMEQLRHLGRVLAEMGVEFGVVVEDAARNVVEERFRRGSVGEEHLVGVRLDVIGNL